MNTFIVYIFPNAIFDEVEFDRHMREYPHWARLKKDLWLVAFSGNAAQLRDQISAAVNKNCAVLAINISGDGWATLNMDRKLTDWMTEYV